MRAFPCLLSALLPILLGAATAPDPIYGEWVNPKHTLAVRTAPCGDEVCGTIVAATREALQDAKDAGVNQLIGTQLLRGYRKTGEGRWSGTVFVPDMGRSFSSHIVALSPNTLRISGCILGGLICKSQDWTRR
jgi:uncharacterized protein (DUF2147 family)